MNMTGLRNTAIKVAGAMIATGLAASAAFAATGDTVNVTLPEAVTVGHTTLPGGTYQISEVPVGAESLFLFRDSHGNTAAVAEATRTASPTHADSKGASQKTEIVLAPSKSGKMHIDEMFVEGDTAGYRFTNPS